MATFKCKMCGGDLILTEGSTVCECEFCGTRQTVPSADNEKKMTLFTRAGRLLRNCEFDKASGVFETIVGDFPEEAEAYWGLVLCKYGIENVDDPATGRKVPTCHRSSFEGVLDDANFEQACENADAVARRVYRDEARQIEELRKGIIEVSGKEDPYDIFISYKETDEHGDRTLDSVIAQDIYKALTDEGYRVFFSRISLESKLGTEYEPYIFAALNSAKVMLVVGTDYDNFDSVWVKNEWSRFLKLIASGQKKTLIPVFKNMNAYDMPKEFAKLSAQDMGKVGAMQDLIRGVEKLAPLKKAENPQVEKVTEKVIVQQQSEGSMKTDAAIKRGKLALEDGEWEKARQYFDQALTLDAECAEAYFGIALADFRARDPESFIRTATGQTPRAEKMSIPEDNAHIRKMVAENAVENYLSEGAVSALYQYDLSYTSTLKGQQEIQNQIRQQVENNRNLSRALRFAQGEEKSRIEGFRKSLYDGLQENEDKARKQEEENRKRTEQKYQAFLKEADGKAREKNREASARRTKDYQNAVGLQGKAMTVAEYQTAIAEFKKTPGFQDAVTRIRACEKAITDIQERERWEREEQARKAAAKKKRTRTIIAVVACMATACLYQFVLKPMNSYNNAESYEQSGDVVSAYEAFVAIGNYKDSVSRADNLYGQYKEEKYKEEKLKNAKIGDIISFGAYEQDNNTSNGKEDIEWLVLDKQGSKLLLLSEYALDFQPYNTNHTNITWEKCTLRTWLNDDFLQAAFSDSEQKMIPTVTVSADKNPSYSTSPGNDTRDKVFLLSITEVNKYFSSNEARKCAPTAYAKAQGAYTNDSYKTADGEATCWWWLRSPGFFQTIAESVDAVGSVSNYGDIVGDGSNAVRPALWINLES